MHYFLIMWRETVCLVETLISPVITIFCTYRPYTLNLFTPLYLRLAWFCVILLIVYVHGQCSLQCPLCRWWIGVLHISLSHKKMGESKRGFCFFLLLFNHNLSTKRLCCIILLPCPNLNDNPICHVQNFRKRIWTALWILPKVLQNCTISWVQPKQSNNLMLCW